MATKRARLVTVLCGLLLSLLVAGCVDMAVQPTFRRQEPPRLSFPAGSVPTTGQTPVYTQEQATALENPLAGQQGATQAGAGVYSINCRMCHGDDGKGTGAIASYFPPKPTDLTDDRLKGYRDAQIFWAVTNGFGRMPAFQKVLSPDERWQVVNHVRALQGQ